MLRMRTILIAASMILFSSAIASANTILVATLTNSQENPPTNPTTLAGVPRVSSGTAMFVLNDAMTSMTFTATIFGIDFTGTQSADPNDNLVAAHIHAAPLGTPTTNAPVVWGFFGNPFNDNNPNDVVVIPFPNGVGAIISGKWDAPEGNGTTLAAQLPNILSGNSYINFHTTQFGGGEIRGAITLVPEPTGLVLLAAGMLGLLGFHWRHRPDSQVLAGRPWFKSLLR